MSMEQNPNKEVWRPAKGFDGIYEVSNYGRVLSRNLYHRKGPVILKAWLGNRGYLRITLRKNGVIVHKQVATLVAEAFLPNPNNLPQVNHKDENKTNNFVWVNEDGSVDIERSNLEWCSCKQNINHGTRNKRMVETRTRSGQSRGEKAVVQLSLDGRFINVFRSMCEAERETGAYSSIICKCCKGIKQKHHGYKWLYLNDYILKRTPSKEEIISQAQTLFRGEKLNKKTLFDWINKLNNN